MLVRTSLVHPSTDMSFYQSPVVQNCRVMQLICLILICWIVILDHSPFLGTESSFYRRSKINKYTRRLLKTRRGRLDITLWPYEDYSITQDDSMRHHYLARITSWDTLTRRGRLNEGNSMRVTRWGDDSKGTTRRGSHDKARWFDETTLSHKGGTSVLRIVLTSLFIFFNH